ncbi:prepilin-type N-terminal cleavage/methylation domain-containing protein [Marinilactibacillus sp. GCM10026970]|uniref:type IV pilus modification PilV family protein n=1 Tax=Marinilactibacillus sp. GCM10026970 TaxID=3252642 RepID=UPI003617875F
MVLKRYWSLKRFYHDQAGATLVELIASIAILALVVTSFLTFFIQSSKATQSSEQVTAATYSGQKQMEYLYHLSETLTIAETVLELATKAQSTNSNGLEKSYTYQEDGISYLLEMTLPDSKTSKQPNLIRFILEGSKDGKKVIQLENKIPFKVGQLDE